MSYKYLSKLPTRSANKISMKERNITALIVDDEPLARSYVRNLLKTDDEIKIIGECGNGLEAVDFIAKNNPQLVFLDVQMPELDGLSMLKKLGSTKIPAIIFTTAFEEYAIRAFEFHALDYLLKPFDEERFNKAVKFAKIRLLNPLEKKQEEIQISELAKNAKEKSEFLERLLIKQNGRIIFLKVSEIDLIRADDKYVQLHAGKTIHLIRQTLSAMNKQLDPQKFVQIHRSIIINVERIKELQTMFSGDYTIVMENEAEIPLNRNYRKRLFEIIGNPL